jgi:ubiquinone/menaquinone biosynthesis C-methylase UbiE
VSKPLTDIRAETERVRELQDKQAPGYDRQISFFERVLFGDGRQWATSQLRGDVLEIATGTGRNFDHYRAETRLTAIELSREMLAVARERAANAEMDVDLREGDAQALDFPDESLDSVLITVALCTIPDDRKAAEEASACCARAGGSSYLEHVRSPLAAVRVEQRMLQPFALRFQGDNWCVSLDYLSDIGFEVENVTRLKWGIVERTVARRPISGST